MVTRQHLQQSLNGTTVLQLLSKMMQAASDAILAAWESPKKTYKHKRGQGE
jgi:hypothetical protein